MYRDPKDRRDPGESREEVAYRIAWAAIERVFEKDTKKGRWGKKS